MKTIEEKAKAYDEAIEKFDVILNLNTVKESGTISADDVRKILPELKDSEDEKTRKALISFLKSPFVNENITDEKVAPWLAWLEAQGGQKPADNVEPKFKVGDWWVHKDLVGVTCCITQIHAPHYYLTNNNSFIKFGEENNYRPWTIQYAKEGDVLVHNDGSLTIFRYRLSGLDAGLYMSHVLLTDKIGFKQTCVINNVQPATKEQRDLLFQKMKEAGYEWDAEKKELKKIEQKPTVIFPKFRVGDEIKTANEESLIITKIDEKGYWSEDLFICDFDEECIWDLVEQPAWSEEDENMLNHIINDIESLKEQVYCKNLCNEEIDWLKSLRHQNTWKPSDEQIEALDFAADCIVPAEFCFKRKVLKELLKQLKKLKE